MASATGTRDETEGAAETAARDPLAISPEVKASLNLLIVDDDRTLREGCIYKTFFNSLIDSYNHVLAYTCYAVLSDRCPGLTERSRIRCRVGFLGRLAG